MPKITDLTMQMDGTTPVFPGDPEPKFKQSATIGKNGWNEKKLEFGSHFGTHIDAPYHMLVDGKKLDEYPIGYFFGKAFVANATRQNAKNEISADIRNAKNADFIFFCTGHSKKAHGKNYFENNPVIPKLLAEELVRRKTKIIGIDSFTPDNPPYEIHKLLFSKNILIVENLVNLERLKGKEFDCAILPLKITGADGAPCRVVAIHR